VASLLVVAELDHADADPVQQHADPLLVAERPEERKALLVRPLRWLVVPREPQRAGETAKGPGPKPLGQLVREELLEPPGAFERVRRDPEVLEQDHQLPGLGEATGRHRAVERGAKVLLLADQKLRLTPIAALRRGIDAFGEREVDVEVAPSGLLQLAGLLEKLERELADRLQQRVALAVEADEALVHERLDRVEARARNGFRRLERPAAGEHA
jgi:hypothetical protein